MKLLTLSLTSLFVIFTALGSHATQDSLGSASVSLAGASVPQDVQVVSGRRISIIVGSVTGSSSICNWFVDQICLFFL